MSGWAFQLNYRTHVASIEHVEATNLKVHAKRMVDRFLKLMDDANMAAAAALNVASA